MSVPRCSPDVSCSFIVKLRHGGGGLDAESHQAVKSRSLETIPNFRFDSIHSRK